MMKCSCTTPKTLRTMKERRQRSRGPVIMARSLREEREEKEAVEGSAPLLAGSTLDSVVEKRRPAVLTARPCVDTVDWTVLSEIEWSVIGLNGMKQLSSLQGPGQTLDLEVLSEI